MSFDALFFAVQEWRVNSRDIAVRSVSNATGSKQVWPIVFSNSSGKIAARLVSCRREKEDGNAFGENSRRLPRLRVGYHGFFFFLERFSLGTRGKPTMGKQEFYLKEFIFFLARTGI